MWLFGHGFLPKMTNLLLYFSPSGNFPYVFYIAISHGIDFIVEVGGHALVQGDDGEAVAYGEGVVTF